MDFNHFIFPAPESSYSQDDYQGELLFVPRRKKPILPHLDPSLPIPCLYMPCHNGGGGSTKLMIYFHGNAEDLGLSWELLDHLRSSLKMHVLAVEYPGYGIYPGVPTAEKILEDALSVWEYLTLELGVKRTEIILFGRSLGSGPAIELAAHVNPCALLLMTAYLSIREVVRSLAGGMAAYLVHERFRNIENIKEVGCPTFLIHGQRDTLIPASHSQELHSACGGPASLLLSNDMDHNEFDFYEDLSHPFNFFLQQCGISSNPTTQTQQSPESVSPAMLGDTFCPYVLKFPNELKYRDNPDPRFTVKRKENLCSKFQKIFS
ncbi:hypothetical protein FGO68_gene10863 [Halteria grandinella]|uniref:Serine aminopeptidase S33 domain-containing protein n=1 Tax=Halteria grandinella TaxID=5974 RepID=A0A8J8T160_HALGN|nr:hypothetical protein FGO68_gene10863 [Halteria grandinella]